jgi:Protein of unknown function (DUF3828)
MAGASHRALEPRQPLSARSRHLGPSGTVDARLRVVPWRLAWNSARAGRTANDPVAVITAIYKTYQSDADPPAYPKAFSRRLQGLIDEDEKNTPKGYVGKIDWDVFVDGQDWKLTHLRIILVARSNSKARVRVTFENFNSPCDIAFDLVREDGRWVIDEIASQRPGHRWIMSKILSDAADAFPDQKK